jgi:hypothetical protein
LHSLESYRIRENYMFFAQPGRKQVLASVGLLVGGLAQTIGWANTCSSAWLAGGDSRKGKVIVVGSFPVVGEQEGHLRGGSRKRSLGCMIFFMIGAFLSLTL